MPLSIPAFDQYQAPLVPLRGIWNHPPKEGDRYINVEIDWLVTTTTNAVQLSVGGNSPVSLSQIAALSVDNRRCGTDVDFVFPDSGFTLTVPAFHQVVTPVFTNALTFYVIATLPGGTDRTIFQILNSIPPPIPIQPSTALTTSALSAPAGLATTQVIPISINGTLASFSITISNTQGAAVGKADFVLMDSAPITSNFLWSGEVVYAANETKTYTFNVPVSARFYNGLRFFLISNTLTAATFAYNMYYSTP